MSMTVKQVLHEVSVWIDATPMSQAIQTHAWVVPAVQTVHILAIAALMGAALMINLRLAGWLRGGQTMSEVAARFVRVIGWALPVLLVSGAILIVGEPARSLKNVIFQWKMGLVCVAGLLTWQFARTLAKDPARWDRGAAAGKALALVSMSLWVAIVFAGRWIAYF